jgi:hypothetical protein
MNAIHGRNRSVPRIVDLELMAKICVIINYLQCHESMDLICDIWKTGIAKAVPNKVCRDLVLCTFIACVCGGPKLFMPAVRPAILEGQAMLPSLGLPFNPGVLGKLPGLNLFMSTY